jgi:Aspartate/tyrosine/aromatic aminotransferase
MDKIKPSLKLSAIPPYLFSRINAVAREAYGRKLDVIDLGMGNPDLPTPCHIVDRLVDTVKNHPRTHRYPQAKGMPRFRNAVARWMFNRFGVCLDPEKEIIALIGSKEGIAHMCMAYLDPGDIALVCNPAYPVHFNGVILAGGKVHSIPLREENKFIPDLSKIPEKIAKKAKLLFLNYPNNPTAAVVEDKAFLEEVVAFAKKIRDTRHLRQRLLGADL